MIFHSTFVILLLAASIERSAPADRLCADAEILKNRFPQLSDCVLTWIKNIPENVDDYCATSTDLLDFCSRLEQYKSESCAYFRSNIDHWVECMAYYNFHQGGCRAGSKCPQMPLYDAIPNCNLKNDLKDYESCMESGSSRSLFRDNYFGVPTYWIIIILGLSLTLTVLVLLHKSIKASEKASKKEEEEKDDKKKQKKVKKQRSAEK